MSASGIVVLAAAAFAALLASYLLARRRARRLEADIDRIARAADRAAGGDLAVELSGLAEESAEPLSRALDRMRRALLQQVRDAEAERSLLASVVGGMKEGLVVVGPDRRVRLANAAFRQVARLATDPTGHLLAEVVRHPGVLEEVEASLRGGGEPRESLVHFAGSGRSFELQVSPLGEPGTERSRGALVLFVDVTRLEALERVRRDFVANVSHELRTPLTSIKAFVETLIEERLEDRDQSLEFLGIVRKHADRMGALIDDLTDLSLIETGSVALEIRDVDAREVAEEVASQLAHKASASEVQIRIELEAGFTLRADRRRFEQILVNLVDNGIKFNRRGGWVRISGAAAEGRRLLSVEDTGIGIPDDHREKVFHRFHRVDTERSRAAGGTGLGLAIVKHLMWLHGGEVRLESEAGVGSRFVLEFPAPGSGGGPI